MPEDLAPVDELGALSVSNEQAAPRRMAPMRGPYSLLAIVRHAEEGPAPEPSAAVSASAADVIAEADADEAGEDGDGAVEQPPPPPPRVVEDPGEGNRALGITGEVRRCRLISG